MEIDFNAIKTWENVMRIVSDYVYEHTKIDDKEGQTIEGLSDIISIPGIVSTVKKKNAIPTVKKNKVKKRGKGESRKSGGENPTPKPPRPHPKPPRPVPPGENAKSYVVDDFAIEPTFIKQTKKYKLIFIVNDDLQKADVLINSVNSEGRDDDSIADYISGVSFQGQNYKCENGLIRNMKFDKGVKQEIILDLKRDITYQLSASVVAKGDKSSD